MEETVTILLAIRRPHGEPFESEHPHRMVVYSSPRGLVDAAR